MKNILIKAAVVIMLSALNVVFGESLAMDSGDISAGENNYILTKIDVGPNTYTRYTNDVIFRFDETIGQRFGKEVQIYGAKAQTSDTIAEAVERYGRLYEFSSE